MALGALATAALISAAAGGVATGIETLPTPAEKENKRKLKELQAREAAETLGLTSTEEQSLYNEGESLMRQRQQEAEGAGIRIDHGIAQGTDDSPYYDSMLGKIIAFGRDREQARRRVIRAITDSHLLGVVTNRTFLKQILSDPRFIDGQATTAFIDQATLDQATHASSPLQVNLALAAVLLLSQKEARNGGLWRWSNVGGMAMRVALSAGEDSRSVCTWQDCCAQHPTCGNYACSSTYTRRPSTTVCSSTTCSHQNCCQQNDSCFSPRLHYSLTPLFLWPRKQHLPEFLPTHPQTQP